MCTKETKRSPERYLFRICFTISRLFSSHDGVVNSQIFILLKAKLLLFSYRIVFHRPTRPSIRKIYRAFHINNGQSNHIFQGDGYLHVSTCSMVSPSCHSLPSSLLFGLGGGFEGPHDGYIHNMGIRDSGRGQVPKKWGNRPQLPTELTRSEGCNYSVECI